MIDKNHKQWKALSVGFESHNDFQAQSKKFQASPDIFIEMFSKNSVIGSLSFFGDDDDDDVDAAAAAAAAEVVAKPLSSTLIRAWFSKVEAEAAQMSPPSNFNLDQRRKPKYETFPIIFSVLCRFNDFCDSSKIDFRFNNNGSVG